VGRETNVSKKLMRLQGATGGPKRPGKRRRVRAFVARKAARDFYRFMLMLGVLGAIYSCLQVYAFLD
jgi:hypothetical protein